MLVPSNARSSPEPPRLSRGERRRVDERISPHVERLAPQEDARELLAKGVGAIALAVAVDTVSRVRNRAVGQEGVEDHVNSDGEGKGTDALGQQLARVLLWSESLD